MKEFLEIRTPFFAPVWRRVLVTAVLALWTLVEATSGAGAWTVLFGAATVWVFWSFFVAWRDPEDP